MTIRTILVSFLALAIPTNAIAGAPWSTEDARLLSEIASSCSGGEYSDGETRTAQMIAASLPRAGEEANLLDKKRAHDVYLYAGALLKPSIANPERALDPSSFVKCPPNPALGVKLMEFLIGDEPGRNKGPNNAYYWLGIANRRGVGVSADAVRARQYFLQARALGIWNLTAEDWGTSPNDQLLTVARKPENFRWIEAAAAAGKQGSIVLLAEMVVDREPARARSLLSAQPDDIFAARKFAEFEMEGKFGSPHPEEAVRAMAHFQRLSRPYYDLMLRAARQYNAPEQDIPTSPQQVTLDELGGKKLLLAGQKEELDAIRGVVTARALVDPTGTILYTEVPDPQISRFRMAFATLKIFTPSLLNKVAPFERNGRAIFHWLNLPPVRWAPTPGTSVIRVRAEDLR